MCPGGVAGNRAPLRGRPKSEEKTREGKRLLLRRRFPLVERDAHLHKGRGEAAPRVLLPRSSRPEPWPPGGAVARGLHRIAVPARTLWPRGCVLYPRRAEGIFRFAGLAAGSKSRRPRRCGAAPGRGGNSRFPGLRYSGRHRPGYFLRSLSGRLGARQKHRCVPVANGEELPVYPAAAFRPPGPGAPGPPRIPERIFSARSLQRANNGGKRQIAGKEPKRSPPPPPASPRPVLGLGTGLGAPGNLPGRAEPGLPQRFCSVRRRMRHLGE
ncbi:uncharacterized protein [Patagioenas fasciata]|uniref:uncharacterized protein n=1 Tax=Patagioenas fasciata TaxID=372321 RepID=UPI003A995842